MGCFESKETGPSTASAAHHAITIAPTQPTALKQPPEASTGCAADTALTPVAIGAAASNPPPVIATATSPVSVLQAKPVTTPILNAADRFKQQHGTSISTTSSAFTVNESDPAQSHPQPQELPIVPSRPEEPLPAAQITGPVGAGPRNSTGGRAGPPSVGIPPEDLIKDVQHLTWLGQGGYGAVYQGIWHGAYVAVKFIASDTVDPESASYREAQLSTLLAHPNVVQAFWTRSAMLTEAFIEFSIEDDGGEGSAANRPRPEFVSGEGFGDPYGNDKGKPVFTMRDVLQQLHCKAGQFLTVIAMEYCDKGSLHQVIYKSVFKATDKWSDRIALRALIRSAREIAQGIWHLHNSGVIHGDMKPGNVLLKSSRSDRRGFLCKVSDFGLARETFGAADIHASTWATINYMAPEHFEGHLSKPSDVYSFGVVLWEMYNAERPYRDFTQGHPKGPTAWQAHGRIGQVLLAAGQVMMGVREGTLRPTWSASTPAPLVQLASACMAQDPAERPTFEAIMQQLTNMEGDMRMEEYSKRNVANGKAAAEAIGGSSASNSNLTSTFSTPLPNAAPGLVAAPGVLGGAALPNGRPHAPPILEEQVILAVRNETKGIC